VYEARENGLPSYEGGIVTNEFLRELADYLEAADEQGGLPAEEISESELTLEYEPASWGSGIRNNGGLSYELKLRIIVFELIQVCLDFR
jgi:hypothetical protein